jgi:uncharacterized protein
MGCSLMYPLLTGPLTIERVDVPMADLAPALQGKVIVQLSDFHYDGLRLSDQLLDQVIETVAAIRPDLLVLTGDFITKDPTPIYELTRRLKTLSSRFPTFAILGNHDLYPVAGARETVTVALQAVDIAVLWNQIVYPLGEQLALVGLADIWSDEFTPAQVFEQINPAIPRVVLSHNPDSAEALTPWRIDLQLSGHTHGGQIVFPGWGNAPQLWDQIRGLVPAEWRKDLPYLSEKRFKIVDHWEWSMGLHRVGNNRLYVNRGLGTYLPGRLFCPPEVSVITLSQQAK